MKREYYPLREYQPLRSYKFRSIGLTGIIVESLLLIVRENMEISLENIKDTDVSPFGFDSDDEGDPYLFI